MAALDCLNRAGLTVEVVADKLRVSPRELVTPELHQYIVANKIELLAELGSSTVPQTHKSPALRLVENTSLQAAADAPTPVPAAEAASEPQRIVQTAATASPEWTEARDQYLNHVMSCQSCYAPTGRYCPTGVDLGTAYDTTPMELTQ